MQTLSRSFLLIFLLLALAACQPGASEPAVDDPPAQDASAQRTAPTDTPTPEPEPTPEPVPEATDTPAAETPPEISTARTIEEVESITSYRMLAGVSQNAPDNRGSMQVEAQGAYAKEPAAEQLIVAITEREDDPVVMEIRVVDGQMYLGMNDSWAEISRFELAEATVATPDQITGVVGDLQLLGREELHGRTVVHLQGQKELIPVFNNGSDTVDFSRMDTAVLDVWVDEAEQFIVKMTVQGEIGEEGEVSVYYEYLDFNQPVTVTVPESIAQAEPTPTPDPQQVSDVLGFAFPVPEGTRFQIFGATATLLTELTLEEAQQLVIQTLEANGFSQESVEERTPNEFFYVFSNGERTVTANVFPNGLGGTTINIGAAK